MKLVDKEVLEQEHIVNICGMLPMRCDRYISQIWGICSRSQLRMRISSLYIDSIPSKFSQKVYTGQQLKLYWKKIEEKLLPQEIAFDVLYEDEDVWVINKPSGLVVHPGVGHKSGTLANALVFRLKSLLDQFHDSMRAGIVHRLDCDTSGVMICAKHVEAHEFLSQQFKKRSVLKYYLALCRSSDAVSESGIVQNYIFRSPIERKQFSCGLGEQYGKFAITEYVIVKKRKQCSLILLKPHTGRTHQLRVHMKFLGLPILGDPLYHRNCSFLPLGLMLHAWKLCIILPKTGKARLFTAAPPQRLQECWMLN